MDKVIKRTTNNLKEMNQFHSHQVNRIYSSFKYANLVKLSYNKSHFDKDVISKEIAFGLHLQIFDLRCVIPLSIAAAQSGTCVMSQYINPHSGRQLSDRLPCVSTAAACPPADVL